MQYTNSGENKVRHHEFKDENGNKLYVNFRDPTRVRVACDEYLYNNCIYKVRAMLVKRVELLDTREPFYLSGFTIEVIGNGQDPSKATFLAVSEQIVTSVNALLVDTPNLLQDVHKWQVASELRELTNARSKAMLDRNDAENEIIELQEEINRIISKYPDAETWYVYLDKR